MLAKVSNFQVPPEKPLKNGFYTSSYDSEYSCNPMRFKRFCFILQNIIASTDAEHIPEVLFNLILHEISHALGFSKTQFQK